MVIISAVFVGKMWSSSLAGVGRSRENRKKKGGEGKSYFQPHRPKLWDNSGVGGRNSRWSLILVFDWFKLAGSGVSHVLIPMLQDIQFSEALPLRLHHS